MDAFPAVLRKVPSAKLIIAGANHHTKPRYWESMRESLSPGSGVEFRGYVPEEAIPDLFQTSTVVVMPYDSATGSSGPAHQACEYGVPIVCADIADFRDMAADEDMAIDFYKVGDAVDLADKLVQILQSPEQQQQMAERNFSAAMQMTMSSVVRNYLRWFELKRCKKATDPAPLFAGLRSFWRRNVLPRIDAFSKGQTLRSGRQKLRTAKDQPDANPPQSPQLADDF
jgi:glycosyltransferase involved in cell wall biosynthesis